MGRKLFLLLFILFVIRADGVIVKINNQNFKIANIHRFGHIKECENVEFFLVSKVRDIFLIPVKSPSFSDYELKNPSNLPLNSKIKLKSDGEKLTGKVIAISEYYYQTDIDFKRGDSGKIVFDSCKRPVGLVSHYILKAGKKLNFTVRIDNLQMAEFEKVPFDVLLADWHIFNNAKKTESELMNVIKNTYSAENAEKILESYLKKNSIPPICKSAYLKKMTLQAHENIRACSGK